jgi:hypothetical protein
VEYLDAKEVSKEGDENGGSCEANAIIYHTPRSPADHHSAKDATQSYVRGDSLKVVLMNIPMKDYMPLCRYAAC